AAVLVGFRDPGAEGDVALQAGGETGWGRGYRLLALAGSGCGRRSGHRVLLVVVGVTLPLPPQDGKGGRVASVTGGADRVFLHIAWWVRYLGEGVDGEAAGDDASGLRADRRAGRGRSRRDVARAADAVDGRGHHRRRRRAQRDGARHHRRGRQTVL